MNDVTIGFGGKSHRPIVDQRASSTTKEPRALVTLRMPRSAKIFSKGRITFASALRLITLQMKPEQHRNNFDGQNRPLRTTYEAHNSSRGGSYITKCLSDHKYGLNWPKTHLAKITPKITCSALPEDPIAVTLVTYHSIFIKRP